MSEQQTVPTTPWWKNKKIIIRIVVPAVLVVIVFIVFITAAYTFHWGWTGLLGSHKTTTITEVTQPANAKKVTTTVEDQPAKTLWDGLPLLIQLLGALAIPVVVAVGTAVFTTRQTRISEENRKQQHDTDLQIAENQQQEELLRTYFDKISELLLNKELSTNPNIQSIVRARTLAALHILNAERKSIVLRFLHDSDLLQYVKSFLYSLDLSHTDLNRIYLSKANLSKANLDGATLSGANLGNATLSGANLGNANLDGADLREADLDGATLSGADLVLADLDGADLNGANLSGANLSGANLSGANLGLADLSGALLIEADLSKANLSGANLSGALLIEANLSKANLSRATLSGANLGKATLDGANLSRANLIGANLSRARITPEQLKEAKNITPEQLTQIKPKLAAPLEAKAEQASTTPAKSEIQPDQTSQKDAEQQEHKHPKQGTDAAH